MKISIKHIIYSKKARIVLSDGVFTGQIGPKIGPGGGPGVVWIIISWWFILCDGTNREIRKWIQIHIENDHMLRAVGQEFIGLIVSGIKVIIA